MNANRLQDPVFAPLPLGSVLPRGWLRDQLRIQADGLTGHLDEFWPDVARSGWIGGDAEGWERGPYWLDGLVPLAFLLRDESLVRKADRWMDYILSHQDEDGWLGPSPDGRQDPWPVFVFAKAAILYHEATDDERVVPALERFFRKLDALLDGAPLSSWAAMRWPDLLPSLFWLYGKNGDDGLLRLAGRASRQGYDWRSHFLDLPFPEKRDKWAYDNHVVNHAMAMKTAAVLYRMTGDPEDAALAWIAVETMDRHHGQATGVFTGDESLAGLMPSQGTELCAVVEYLFSLETLVSVLGGVPFADRLEKIAFNALPATFKPDMWAHQYDQQANQVLCAVSEENVWTNNGPESNIYGLEPNFGCCTANMHQGWPKFAMHLWMRSDEEGLAAIAYAPCEVRTRIGGAAVRVEVDTRYPFRDEIRIRVRAEAPAKFPLLLRIPGWCRDARVDVDGSVEDADAGAFHRIDRTWDGEIEILLTLPMRAALQERFGGAVSIERGPLVYSLRIGEEWKRIHEDVEGRELPHGDWEVHPTTPWNYALAIDRDHPERSLSFEERNPEAPVFSPEGAPVVGRVRGRRLPSWGMEKGAAAPPPQSPVESGEPEEELRLLPYGCTNLRITEFPVLG